MDTNDIKKIILILWQGETNTYRLKSIFWHNLWKECGRPSDYYIADIRRKTRRDYHYC